MGAILKKLWTDPDYFNKTLAFLIGVFFTVLPTLPLGELGQVGYWLGKIGLPFAIAWGATSHNRSGISAEEAAKLRALIPTQEILNRKAPELK